MIEFQQLEQQARNIAINRTEDKKVTRALEREGAFRAPIEARGVIRTRNRPGKARFEGTVRPLENGKVEFGRAVDANTGQSFPAKLVAAVPTASETIPEEALQDGRPQWRVEQNREIFAPFLQPTLDFVGEDTKSASDIKKFLVALPRLNFNEAVRRAFGAAKAPVKEFLASFAEKFEYNKRLTQVRLKGVTRRRRLRGKQQARPSLHAASPAHPVPSQPGAFLSPLGAPGPRLGANKKMHKAAIDPGKSIAYKHKQSPIPAAGRCASYALDSGRPFWCRKGSHHAEHDPQALPRVLGANLYIFAHGRPRQEYLGPCPQVHPGRDGSGPQEGTSLL